MAEEKPKILCLDDQRENLRIRKLFLEQFGCEVIIAEEPQVCLRTITEQKFDLAVLDYHLGGVVTGEDVARDIRACLPEMPLIMLTGDPKIPQSAAESVDCVLIKGAGSAVELLDAIQTFLPDRLIGPRRQPLSAYVLLSRFSSEGPR